MLNYSVVFIYKNFIKYPFFKKTTEKYSFVHQIFCSFYSLPRKFYCSILFVLMNFTRNCCSKSSINEWYIKAVYKKYSLLFCCLRFASPKWITVTIFTLSLSVLVVEPYCYLSCKKGFFCHKNYFLFLIFVSFCGWILFTKKAMKINVSRENFWKLTFWYHILSANCLDALMWKLRWLLI